MTRIDISSHICDFNHTIMGRVEGNRIIIKIITPCEKFRELNFLEFPRQKLPNSQSDLILEMEKQINSSFECTKECALDFTRKCLILSSVLDICNMEDKLVKKSAEKLLKITLLKDVEYTISES
jgi:hypothetical protein